MIASPKKQKSSAKQEKEKKFCTIGELTALFDITSRTLRYYEQEGLLTPERIGNQRRYTHKHKTRIMLILRGKRLGFSLDEIRRIFQFYDKTKSDGKQLLFLKDLILKRMTILEQQKEDIIHAEKELYAMLKHINRSLPKHKKPPKVVKKIRQKA